MLSVLFFFLLSNDGHHAIHLVWFISKNIQFLIEYKRILIESKGIQNSCGTPEKNCTVKSIPLQNFKGFKFLNESFDSAFCSIYKNFICGYFWQIVFFLLIKPYWEYAAAQLAYQLFWGGLKLITTGIDVCPSISFRANNLSQENFIPTRKLVFQLLVYFVWQNWSRNETFEYTCFLARKINKCDHNNYSKSAWWICIQGKFLARIYLCMT